MKITEILSEAKAVKQRLDAKCWKGKHKEGTKIKGGVRVNNCVPNEGVKEEKAGLYANVQAKRERIKHGSGEHMRKPGTKGAPTSQSWKDAAKTAKTEAANESEVLDKHFGTDPGPEAAYDKQEIRSLLTQAMGKLPAKLERVLRMRYFQNMTLQQIGDKYGLTKNTIRQMEARALRMLKHPSKVGDTLKGSTAAYAEAANPAQQAAIAIAKKKEKGVKEGETGPKFTGYWKGTDKGKPGNKMVGDA